MKVGYRILLWVRKIDDESVSLSELNKALTPIFAHIMHNISSEREGTGQIAIRLSGSAEEKLIMDQLARSRYEVVEREERPTTQAPSR